MPKATGKALDAIGRNVGVKRSKHGPWSERDESYRDRLWNAANAANGPVTAESIQQEIYGACVGLRSVGLACSPGAIAMRAEKDRMVDAMNRIGKIETRECKHEDWLDAGECKCGADLGYCLECCTTLQDLHDEERKAETQRLVIEAREAGGAWANGLASEVRRLIPILALDRSTEAVAKRLRLLVGYS